MAKRLNIRYLPSLGVYLPIVARSLPDKTCSGVPYCTPTKLARTRSTFEPTALFPHSRSRTRSLPLRKYEGGNQIYDPRSGWLSVRSSVLLFCLTEPVEKDTVRAGQAAQRTYGEYHPRSRSSSATVDISWHKLKLMDVNEAQNLE